MSSEKLDITIETKLRGHDLDQFKPARSGLV